MIKAVLFDIDNTLLDFDLCVQEAMKSGFKKFGLGYMKIICLKHLKKSIRKCGRKLREMSFLLKNC